MSRLYVCIIPLIIMISARIKPLCYIFRPLYTLVHELSHAIIAQLFREEVVHIDINNDSSGQCATKTKKKHAAVFISLAGYIVSGVVGYLIILSITEEPSTLWFWALDIITVIALIFHIRNTFGRVWTLFFIGINAIFLFTSVFAPYYAHILYIYGCTIIIENIFSSATLLYINCIDPKKAGDSTNLARFTHIPAFFWSLGFTVFSLWIGYRCVTHMAIYINM